MAGTTPAGGSAGGTGRASEQIYAALRAKVQAGEIALGSFMPTERNTEVLI